MNAPIYFIIVIYFTVSIISTCALKASTTTATTGRKHSLDELLVPTMSCNSRWMVDRDGSEVKAVVGKVT